MGEKGGVIGPAGKGGEADRVLGRDWGHSYEEPVTAESEIRRRIRQRGRITFAEFMEVALFWPEGGYYSGKRRVGAAGDFYTSPSVHPAFGALLSLQLFQMWQVMDEPSPFAIVELGAGDGLLCRDLVSFACHLPAKFNESLHYICLDQLASPGLESEPSDVPSSGEVSSLEPTAAPHHGGPTVHRLTASVGGAYPGGVSRIPLRGVKGCFLSNELLDAMPVHQVTMRQGRLQEIYLSQQGPELMETIAEPSTPELEARFLELGIRLAEGQFAEVNLRLSTWAEQVSVALESGFVLTIDYGHPGHELYSAQRRRGTLTTFHRHTQTDAPYRRIGSQDITAQVDFTSVINAGRQAGLGFLGFTTQRDFLSALGIHDWQQRLRRLALPAPDLQANRAGMLDLLRPGGLGDFQVLVQGKNVRQPALWGFNSSGEPSRLFSKLPVPLLTGHHLPLTQGRYPHTEFEFELQSLWPPDQP